MNDILNGKVVVHFCGDISFYLIFDCGKYEGRKKKIVKKNISFYYIIKILYIFKLFNES